jgi:hypothetical protein
MTAKQFHSAMIRYLIQSSITYRFINKTGRAAGGARNSYVGRGRVSRCLWSFTTATYHLFRTDKDTNVIQNLAPNGASENIFNRRLTR